MPALAAGIDRPLDHAAECRYIGGFPEVLRPATFRSPL
jgi:hypothetical protein